MAVHNRYCDALRNGSNELELNELKDARDSLSKLERTNRDYDDNELLIRLKEFIPVFEKYEIDANSVMVTLK
jgi:hypothetical protein